MGQHSDTKQKQTQTTDMTNTSETALNPYYQNQFNRSYSGLNTMLGALQNKDLGLKKDFSFSSTPSAIVQNMMSRGAQDIKAQSDAAQRALASQVSTMGSGDNSALLGVLGRQAQIANAGATNALIPQALEQQRAMDLENANLSNMYNQTQLAERNAELSTLQPQMNLLQMLGSMAQASGKTTNRQYGTVTTKGKARTSQGYF